MEGILNLYEDNERFFYEKKKLEFFLKNFSPVSYGFFLDELRNDVYIQLLSVLNPLFLKKDYIQILKCIKQAYINRDSICFLQGKISPALLFFPYCNNEICNDNLLLIFTEHIQRPVQPLLYIHLSDNRLFLKITPILYPNWQIYQYKADGADDLIGSTCLELIYKRKDREYIIARVGVFFWNDTTLISCVQNRKIGRINYSIHSYFSEMENFFEIPLFFLSKILCNYKHKKIWFFQNSTHNCRIYTMKNKWFKGVYDKLSIIHKMKDVNTFFWQTEVVTLYEYYRYIEWFFPKVSMQQLHDL